MRLAKLDTLRGLNLISMILYHAMWDLVFLFGNDINWYKGMPGYIWQQSICWIFILLSGFSWNLGKKRLKRGLIVFLCGALITVVTLLFMPDEMIWFGILTFMGSAMLLMIPLDRLLSVLPDSFRRYIFPTAGFALFLYVKHLSHGFKGTGYLTAYFGFPFPGFFSDDYFPLLPWFFLFMTGYGLYHMLHMEKEENRSCLVNPVCPPLEFIGRHTLIIYMLHQPVIFGILSLIYKNR